MNQQTMGKHSIIMTHEAYFVDPMTIVKVFSTWDLYLVNRTMYVRHCWFIICFVLIFLFVLTGYSELHMVFRISDDTELFDERH